MSTAHLLSSLLVLCGTCAVQAQEDTLQPPPWMNREFRYWRGDPMMHGPDGECIAGYTDEDRRLYFFADHHYQEIVFADRGFASVLLWAPGYCTALEGDTVAVLTGVWELLDDTLRVTVERTALYPSEPVLEKYIYRRHDAPLALAVPPARICVTQRDRSFWFKEERMWEPYRVWD